MKSWLITWYRKDGTKQCTVQRFVKVKPTKYAKNRTLKGETYTIVEIK